MVADLQKTVSELPEIQRRMRRLTGQARSADGLVWAKVGPRGHLLELEIDPRVFRKPDSRQLADTIVATVREAVEDVAGQAQKIFERSMPKDLRLGELDGVEGGSVLHRHDADVLREEGREHERGRP